MSQIKSWSEANPNYVSPMEYEYDIIIKDKKVRHIIRKRIDKTDIPAMDSKQLAFKNWIDHHPEYEYECVIKDGQLNSLLLDQFNRIGKMKTEIDTDIFTYAYNIVNGKYPGVFKKGSINRDFLRLERLKPSNCVISGKEHTSNSSYIVIHETPAYHRINIGCNTGCVCNGKKIKEIGRVKKEGYIKPVKYVKPSTDFDSDSE